MPLSRKRDAERKRLARRGVRGAGCVLPGDRGESFRCVVTAKHIRDMNGLVKEATGRGVSVFLSNLRYPARPTYLVRDKVVEPETGEVLADLGVQEERIRSLEERVLALSYAIAELQAEVVDVPAVRVSHLVWHGKGVG